MRKRIISAILSICMLTGLSGYVYADDQDDAAEELEMEAESTDTEEMLLSDDQEPEPDNAENQTDEERQAIYEENTTLLDAGTDISNTGIPVDDIRTAASTDELRDFIQNDSTLYMEATIDLESDVVVLDDVAYQDMDVVYDGMSDDISYDDTAYDVAETIEENGFMELQSVDDTTVTVTSPYQTKRLCVYTDGLASTYGAIDGIYDDILELYILEYASEEDTQKAYEALSDSCCCFTDQVFDEDILEAETWGYDTMGFSNIVETASERTSDVEVQIAVIDTGCDLNHELFQGRIESYYDVYDEEETMSDEHGHGTHCCGIIAQCTSENVKIVPLKVFSEDLQSQVSILTAVQYAISHGIELASLSMGYEAETMEQEGFKEYLEAMTYKWYTGYGFLMVAASGNDGVSGVCYPAVCESVISVGAVGRTLTHASYSNYGEGLDFVAPGTSIKSAYPDKNNTGVSQYAYMSGTSMATPHVAAAMAMIKSAYPGISNDKMIEKAKTWCTDLGDEGWDEYYGYGMIDLSNFEYENLICMEGHSLTLDGLIGINFYVSVDDSVADSVSVSVDGKEEELIDASDKGENWYRVSAYVAAGEVDQDISLIISSGTYSITDTYSVADYLNSAEKTGDESLKEMVTALKDYCYLSKQYFAGDSYTPALDQSSISISEYKPTEKGNCSGLTYIGSSLILDSGTDICHYFSFSGTSVDDYIFTVNGTKVQAEKKGSLYRICVRNVGASDLDTAYTLEVTDSNGNCYSISYSALSYAYNYISKGGSDEKLMSLVKALCLYSAASEQYIA